MLKRVASAALLALLLLPACAPAAAEPTAVIVTPTPLAVEPFAGRYVVMADTAVLRTGPGTDFDEAGTLATGTVIELDGISPAGDWFRIDNGRWIAAGFVAPATAEPAGPDPATDAPADPAPLTDAPAAGGTATAVADATTAVTTATVQQTCRTPPADWAFYQVRAGDTLTGIALATDTTVADLRSFNCLSSDVIVVGQTLRVPADEPTATPGLVLVATAPPAGESGRNPSPRPPDTPSPTIPAHMTATVPPLPSPTSLPIDPPTATVPPIVTPTASAPG